MNRQDLRKKVPHGYSKEIAKRAGVSQKFVSDFLAGKANSERVEMATLEVLAELSNKKRALLEQIG